MWSTNSPFSRNAFAFLLAVGLVPVFAGVPGSAETSDARSGGGSVFEKQVLPVFKAKCARCHGVKKQRAGLSLVDAKGIAKSVEAFVESAGCYSDKRGCHNRRRHLCRNRYRGGLGGFSLSGFHDSCSYNRVFHSFKLC